MSRAETMVPSLSFALFGGLRVDDDRGALDLGPPKQRAVLALLVLEAGHPVATERIVELLWHDDLGAVAALQTYVSRLRRVLEPGRQARDASVLVTRAPGYCLVAPADRIDLSRFERDVRAGCAAAERGRLDEAVRVLDAALGASARPILPEFGDAPFVVDAARRVDELRTTAVERLGETQLLLGLPTAARSTLEPAVQEHPDRERLVHHFALALYREQRQADALTAIDRCRRALRERAGLEPGPDLQRLELDILGHSAHLEGSGAAARPPSGRRSSPVGGATAAQGPPVAGGLVGRARELQVFQRVLDEATAGRGTAVVVSGEPGIGKSALASTLASSAGSQGFTTTWVRCAEHRTTTPRWLGLAPEPSSAAAPTPDPDDRSRLFESIEAHLRHVVDPLVVVVDDAQWADPDALRLLQHLAVDLPTLPIVVVATTRPPGPEAPPALLDALAELARVPGSQQLVLERLSLAEVSEWISHRGEDVADGVAQLIHERTAGNPLFVREVTELLASAGRLRDEQLARSDRAIPAGVQLVVRRRVSQLDTATQRLLSIAAVLGGRTSSQTLADVAGLSVAETVESLAPAFDAGLLVGGVDEPSFSHALVAEALASEVNEPRRVALHAAAARAMAARSGEAFDVHAAAIAHHATVGIPEGTGPLAIEAGTRAATRATAWSAHEDAAAHWAQVADALRRSAPRDVLAHVSALVEQARSLVRVDMERHAKQPILEAIRAADAVGAVDSMAEAAGLLNHSNVWSIERYGDVNEAVVAALERTISLLSPADPRRARLMGALPSELVFADPARHRAACERSIQAARAVGDPTVVALALNNAMLPKRPAELDLRTSQADEMLLLAAASDLSIDLQYAAHHHRAEAHLERGELDAAHHQLEAGRHVLTSAPGSRLNSQYLWFAATLANATGRYEDSRRLGEQAFELQRRRRRHDADVLMFSGQAAWAIDRGGFEQLLDVASRMLDVGAYLRSTAEVMAFGALEAGLVERARQVVDPFGLDSSFPDDYMRLCCATSALHVRVELGARDEARAARAVLDGFDERWAGAGTSPISAGFVSLAIARHDEAEGDTDRAGDGFERATASASAAGTPAWLARTHLHHGAFRLRHGDPVRGEALLREAAELAHRHRLPYVQRRLAELRG